MDIEILLFLQGIREATGGFLNQFFIFITTVAVDHFLLIPMLVLFWTVDKKRGSRILLTWGTALSIGAFLKTIFCVYRPWIRDSRVEPASEVLSGATGYSFPSGHSVSSGGFWNGLAVNYRKYRPLVIFSVSMVLLTMFSRMFLGVHTPQDVLVGASVSLVSAFGIAKMCDYFDAHPDKDWLVPLIATILMIGLLYFIANKDYPQDYVNGVLLVDPKKMTVDGFKDPGRFYGIVLGWFIERRFIHFSTEGTTQQKVMRALVGGLLAAFWWTAIAGSIGKMIGTGLGHFITQATTPLVFMTLYPLCFTKLAEKHKKDNQ